MSAVISDLLQTTGPAQLENEFVHQVYDDIAPHFSDTRYRPWPVVREFLEELPAGAFVCDVGCGNGKYIDVNRQITMFGCDRSVNLLRICTERGFDVVQCDNLNLPYRASVFDHVISIAVLHHLSTLGRRLQAIKEIFRILKPRGSALIFVWAMEQESKQFDQQDTFVPWRLQQQYVASSSSGIYQRYYHLFVKGELEELARSTRMVEIERSGYDHDNWFIVVRRIYCEP